MPGPLPAAAQPEQGQAVLEHVAVLLPASCRLGVELIRGRVAGRLGDGCPRAFHLKLVAPQHGPGRAGETLRVVKLAERSARPDDAGQMQPAPVPAGRRPADRLLVFLDQAERLLWVP